MNLLASIGTKTSRAGVYLAGAVAWLTIIVGPVQVAAAGQNFIADGVQPSAGMLMSLSTNSNHVTLASTKNTSSLVGVIAPNESNFSDQTGKVNVQTDGVANALVSTLDGDIKTGDRITASANEGVGSKAAGNGWIVGIAQAGLNAKTSGAVSTQIKTSNGAQHTIYVASIPVSIKITYYSTAVPVSKSVAPAWLQKLADTIAKKHVSTTALVFSFILFLSGLAAAVVIISSSIRGAFMAVARQPLAKAVIFRTELRSLATAIGILVFVLLASFLLLRFI